VTINQASRPPSIYWFVLAGLILIGFALRLSLMCSAHFLNDEGVFFNLARAWINNGKLPPYGSFISLSQARLPGGLYTLLTAPLLRMWPSPLACSLMVILISMFSYLILVEVIRSCFSWPLALLFTILLVFNPWSLFHSDRNWAPNILILFTATFLWCSSKMIKHPESKYAFWILPLLMGSLQIHISGVLLVAIAIATLCTFRPTINWRYAVLGSIVCILMYLPYLIEEYQNGFANTQALLNLRAIDMAPWQWATLLETLIQVIIFPSAEIGYMINQGYWTDYHNIDFYFLSDGLYHTYKFFGSDILAILFLSFTLISIILSAVALLVWIFTLPILRPGKLKWLTCNPLRIGFIVTITCCPLLIFLSHRNYHPHYIYILFPFTFLPLLELFQRLLKPSSPLYHLRITALFSWAVIAAFLQTAITLYVYQSHQSQKSFPRQIALLEYIYATAAENDYTVRYGIEGKIDPVDQLAALAEFHFGKPFRLNTKAKLCYTILYAEDAEKFLHTDTRSLNGRQVIEYISEPPVIIVKSRSSQNT
jgi:hypothetical protein